MNDDIANKAIESSGLALWQAYCEKKEELEELQEKFHSACWLLREAAEELGRIDYPDVNYPQNSIMQFLDENDN